MEGLGASRVRIIAVLGPSISQANYEVGAEFAARSIDTTSLAKPFLRKPLSAVVQLEVPRGVWRSTHFAERSRTG